LAPITAYAGLFTNLAIPAFAELRDSAEEHGALDKMVVTFLLTLTCVIIAKPDEKVGLY